MADLSDDEEIFSDEEIKEYFRINLMYFKDKDKWIKKTYLHFSLKFPTLTESPEDSAETMLIEYLNKKNIQSYKKSLSLRGKLFNEMSEHAEIILLEKLKTSFNDYKINKTTERLRNVQIDGKREDQKKVEINLELILNHSPCNKCAEIIKTFKKKSEEYCDINISIIFGSFYLIFPQNDKNKHTEGLASLLDAGIKLRLVWDFEPLKTQIDKLEIGTMEERRKRKEMDDKYMQLVTDKVTSTKQSKKDVKSAYSSS